MTKMLATTGILLLAVGLLSGCGSENTGTTPNTTTGQQDQPATQDCVAGFESKWNSTPEDGDAKDFPKQTVTVLTDSGRIIDAHDREQGKAGEPEELGITYKVKQDKSWPARSVVIIDTSNDKVLDTFPLPTDMPICE